ncbi:MAG: alanine racemase [Heliobacteriaceae bacterium]|nr:alanine racemase [Heliobacteriaceae bacterium]MDD4587934.1 alanine racemase [Heliobacteriaceae bacterium]
MNEVARDLPCWVQVDREALGHNVRAVRQFIGETPLLYAVVKADAYGCGSLECARCFLAAGADRLAVSYVSEGIILREGGITAPILVMGPALPTEWEALVHYGLTPSVATAAGVARLAAAVQSQDCRGFAVQIKVETGLGRTGVFPEAAGELAAVVRQYPELDLEGVFTHLATAATGDPRYVHHQVARFREAVRRIEAAGGPVAIKHVANSAAMLAFPEYHFDAVRVGTLLYGQVPRTDLAGLVAVREVWGFKTRVAHLAVLPPGHGIGYGRTFVTRQETKVAVLPVGYIDGFQLEPTAIPVSWVDLIKILGKITLAFLGWRRLARWVTVAGQPARVLGKVAMQFTMVDVTGLAGVKVGDIVDLPARRTVTRATLPRVYVGAAGEQVGLPGA